MLNILLQTLALAQKGEKHCAQITEICQNAGFAPGKQSYGYDLYTNCVNPLLQNKDNGPFALYELPKVHSDILMKCRTENPTFGAGEVGSFGAQHLACYQIKKRCLIDGFMPGKLSAGYDLYRNCINPMFHPTKHNHNSIFPVPDIGKDLIDRCKQEIPHFASSKVGAKHARSKSCHQITSICRESGFEEDKWRFGYDLWKNCINPVMQSLKQNEVPFQLLQLPEVDPKLIQQCRKENPAYGVGLIGSAGGQRHSCFKVNDYCEKNSRNLDCFQEIIRGERKGVEIEIVEQCKEDIPDLNKLPL